MSIGRLLDCFGGCCDYSLDLYSNDFESQPPMFSSDHNVRYLKNTGMYNNHSFNHYVCDIHQQDVVGGNMKSMHCKGIANIAHTGMLSWTKERKKKKGTIVENNGTKGPWKKGGL